MVTATYIDRIKYAQYVDGLVGEILSAPDIGRAVPKVLGELWQRRFVGADPRLVIDSIWSSIYGKVEPGTKYDPSLIASEFWRLHNQLREEWQSEIYIK